MRSIRSSFIIVILLLGILLFTIPHPTSAQSQKGDANRDNAIDLLDFNIWRNEFSGISSTKTSDFNSDTLVDLIDFNIWRTAFLTPVTPTPTQLTTCQKMIIPMYVYWDHPLWDKAINAPQAVHAVILNPNSGPDTTKDAGYDPKIATARTKGIKVLGYVKTLNATIPTSTVRSEIDKYYTWYNVDGIFFDEMSWDASTTTYNYYKSLAEYVRSKNTNPARTLTIANPGGFMLNEPSGNTTPESNAFENHFKNYVEDIYADFEHNWNNYTNQSGFSIRGYRNQTLPSWAYNYPIDKNYHIVFGVPTADLQLALQKSKDLRAKYIYFSDRTEANGPFKNTPIYFDQLTTQLQQNCTQ
jgi:hypothetical protein